ncbi:hypothetical protein CCL09_01925 [Pseudomonas congelans]|nr:hypothetical protein CCL09_01925 [Pseudomonas congelans]
MPCQRGDTDAGQADDSGGRRNVPICTGCGAGKHLGAGSFQVSALSKEQAEAALDEVAGWEAELRDYHSQLPSGAELDAAVDATSGARLKR